MIIITGSGRSGTSIVAKIFSLCKIDLDNVDKWHDEVRAGLEHPEVVAINKLMFEANRKGQYYGTDWLNMAETKKIAKIFKPILLDYSKKLKGKVIKDPLFSKTLPVWIESGAEIEQVFL